MRFLVIIFTFFISLKINAQLGLCQGTKGEVIFSQNFGDGVGIGSPLSNSEITYFYTSNFPEEGQYAIRSNTLPNSDTLPDPNSWLWHLLSNDLSNNIYSTPGKMLLINANGNPGVIYKKRIENLCELTSYEFSFWMAPLYNINSGICEENSGQGIPVNLKIEVWDVSETQLLSSAVTGNVNNTSSISYQQYGLLFTTLSGQEEAVVKISNNNSQSGCGNDLVIDEIKIQLCGGGNSKLTSVEYGDVIKTFCKDDAPINLTLNLENDFNGGYFIWQESNDGNIWSDIDGASIQNEGSSYGLNLNNINSTKFFRAKFASTTDNLGVNGSRCVWYTNEYSVNVLSGNDAPTPFFSSITYCGDSVVPALAVLPTPNLSVNWYDSPVGGTLLHSNSFNFVPSGPGVYFAGFHSEEFSCIGGFRTRIELIWYPGIEVSTNPDPIQICGNEGVILDALHPNSIYEWEPSSLGNGQTAIVYEAGSYVVTIRDPNNPCSEARTRNFTVVGFPSPEISNITNSGSTLTVETVRNDPYEYSLDGVIWQNSNVFQNVESGLVKVYVRDLLNCYTDIEEYFLLSIPVFFTPNGDNANDLYTIKGIDKFNLEVQIFDRYGRVLTILNTQNKYWDGLYQGTQLPSSDYWYIVFKDQQVLKKGHFSLIR
jgi:gliding motility-associated-like protein